MAKYEPPPPGRVKITTVDAWTLGLLMGPLGFSLVLLLSFYIFRWYIKKEKEEAK